MLYVGIWLEKILSEVLIYKSVYPDLFRNQIKGPSIKKIWELSKMIIHQLLFPGMYGDGNRDVKLRGTLPQTC